MFLAARDKGKEKDRAEGRESSSNSVRVKSLCGQNIIFKTTSTVLSKQKHHSKCRFFSDGPT